MNAAEFVRRTAIRRAAAIGVVAALQPHPAPPTRTVIVPVRSGIAPEPPQAVAVAPSFVAAETTTDASPERPTATSASSADEPRVSAAVAPRPLDLVPLSAEKNRMHVTVSSAFARKLEQARAARPDLSDEALLGAGLDLLLRESAKRKGLVERPLKTPRPSKPEHIPAHVKREVWARDGGRCQFRLASGELCGSTHDLQFDHIVPRARGGASTPDDLRLACRPHNLEAARRVFGDAWMDRYCGKTRRRTASALHGAPLSLSLSPRGAGGEG